MKPELIRTGYPEEGVQEIVAKFENEAHVLENIQEGYRQNPTDVLVQFLSQNENKNNFSMKELRGRMKPYVTQEQLEEFEARMAEKSKDGTIGKDFFLVGLFSF